MFPNTHMMRRSLFQQARCLRFTSGNVPSNAPDGLPRSVSENPEARQQADQRLLKIQQSIDPQNNTAIFIARRMAQEKIEHATKALINAEVQIIDAGRPVNPADPIDVQRAQEEQQAAKRVEGEKAARQAGIELGMLAFANADGKSVVLSNWLDEKGANISVQLSNVQTTGGNVTMNAEYRINGETVRKTVTINPEVLRMIGTRIVEVSRSNARNREELDQGVVNGITNSTTVAIGLHEALLSELKK